MMAAPAPAKMIDFRARPHTEPFMSIYQDSGSRNPWAKFRTHRPEVGTLEQYVQELSAEGVSLGVFTGRQGVLAGDHPISNDYIAECVSTYPRRIRGIAGIDPRDTQAAVAEIDRCVLGLKLSGIAFDPPSPIIGDGPSWDSEQMMFPLFQRASELQVPVVLTMGPIVGRHGSPAVVDVVAAEFPSLSIVCSHGVWPQTTELIALAFRRPNVYLETSIYLGYPGAAPLIADAANTLIAEQIIYASAFPFAPLNSCAALERMGLTPEASNAVRYENAARILKLEGN